MSASILVLSEDSAGDAHETLTALARRMLLLLDPGCQTHRIRFEPLTSAQARMAVRGNLWKSKNLRDQGQRNELLRTLATKLLEGERSFVFFHVDGDCSFADRERKGKQSENLAKFAEFKRDLGRLIDMFLQRRREATPAGQPMERLLLLMPFWCMEAWVYQNTGEAIRLCRERYGGRDVDLFLAWQSDRGLLDEEQRPKERTCLAARHNRELAERGFPAASVYEAGKSFAMAVDSLRACASLRSGLEETRV